MDILRILFGIICSILGLIGYKVSFEQSTTIGTIIGFALAVSCFYCGTFTIFTIIGGC